MDDMREGVHLTGAFSSAAAAVAASAPFAAAVPTAAAVADPRPELQQLLDASAQGSQAAAELSCCFERLQRERCEAPPPAAERRARITWQVSLLCWLRDTAETSLLPAMQQLMASEDAAAAWAAVVCLCRASVLHEPLLRRLRGFWEPPGRLLGACWAPSLRERALECAAARARAASASPPWLKDLVAVVRAVSLLRRCRASQLCAHLFKGRGQDAP